MKSLLNPTLPPRPCRSDATFTPVPRAAMSDDADLGDRVLRVVDHVLDRRPAGCTRVTRSLVRILVYAYATGLYSSRRIHAGLVTDADVAMVCHALRITDRTLEDFRRTHLGVIRECLARVLDPGGGGGEGDLRREPTIAGLMAADWRLTLAACEVRSEK